MWLRNTRYFVINRKKETYFKNSSNRFVAPPKSFYSGAKKKL
jgi:hypothetical protein